LSFY
jgi:hypothetical protein